MAKEIAQTELNELNDVINRLREITYDCGDNLDRAGEYTSNKINTVITRLVNLNSKLVNRQ